MDLEKIFHPYGQIKDDLKFITASDVKIKIIISLRQGAKKLSHLKKDIDINSSTILHNMRQLENKKIIIKEFQDYSLSPTGEIMALTLINMMNSIYLTKKNKDFWLNHRVNDIPEALIDKIECLYDIKFLKEESLMFEELLSIPQNTNCIFSNLNYKKLPLDTLLNKNNCLNLILTEDFLNKITQREIENQNRYLKNRNIRLWKTNKDLKLNLIVLKDSMFLNLPNANGNPDNKVYLTSKSKEGIKWGYELFDHYLNQSKEFKI